MKHLFDHGYVNLVDWWGSDQHIVEVARMSTNKGFLGWGPKEDGSPGDEKLLRYLYEHKHHTPFEMAGMIIEVQAPIFVFREWHRHRTQSYNEMSARYTQLPELFYVPSEERLRNGAQSKKNKQGSTEATFNISDVRYRIKESSSESFATYNKLLEDGVAKELARLVLPVNTYSRMRACANLRNWLGFLTLRMDEAAQYEIRMFACAVGELIENKFPKTWTLFAEGKRK